jgi:hypothetical protein
MVLRNDTEFFIPTSRHAQCSLLPYHIFPRSWRYFDQPNPTISILRNKKEFNTELKTYFIKKLSSAFLCNRLFALLVHPLKPKINSCKNMFSPCPPLFSNLMTEKTNFGIKPHRTVLYTRILLFSPYSSLSPISPFPSLL